MIKSKLTNLIAPALILTAPFMSAQPVHSEPNLNLSSSVPVLAVQPVQDSGPNLFLLKVGLALGGLTGVVVLLAAFAFRRVVSTNTVHIVQSGKTTIPHGSGLDAGNVYYEIPTWVPKLGVSVITLPVNNFDLSLSDYEAYDEDRVPFLVDVTAFFRIYDTTIAAKRIANMDELENQLSLIVQGSIRKVLASDKIDNIMTQRSTFGERFTNEVGDQLVEWGVQSIKNMELMDIRDSPKSDVIARIMAKKISEIDRDSRITVAENNRLAKVSEVENLRTSEIASVDAQREVELSKQIAQQQVGEREAERQKAVGVAQEQSQQEVLIQKAQTTERNLAVQRVQDVKQAEIERDTALVNADQEQKVAAIARETALVIADQEKKVAVVDKERAVVQAEQQKETTILVAEGVLASEKNKAEAIKLNGIAKAEAEKQLQLAPVAAQITLAKEIGSNPEYQRYLALIQALQAYTTVGSEQAAALKDADVKIIANGGSAPEGLSKVTDLFSSKGGTSLAAALEAFSQSDLGADLMARFTTPAAE